MGWSEWQIGLCVGTLQRMDRYGVRIVEHCHELGVFAK